MDLTVCLRCSTKVIPKADGTCPACGRPADQPPRSDPIPAALPARRGLWRRATGGMGITIGLLLKLLGLALMIVLFPFGIFGMLFGFATFVYGHRMLVRGKRKRVRDAREAAVAARLAGT